MANAETLEHARKLRAAGWTYPDIEAALGLTPKTAWRELNRARYRASCRESSARYHARDRRPLYSMSLDEIIAPFGATD